MSYMSQIVLKGRPQPVFAKKSQAIEVQRAHVNSEERMFIINGISFRTGDIKTVEVLNDQIHKTIDQIQDSAANRKEREDFLRLSPSKKAENFEIFKTLYQAMTNRMPDEVKLKEAYKLQLDFFTRVTDRHTMPVLFYKPIIDAIPQTKLHPYQTAVISFVSRVTKQDNI